MDNRWRDAIFEKAGVSQSVAMKISGHKTTAIYRYRIIDEEDIGDALIRTQAAMLRWTVVPLAKATEGREE